MLVKKPIYPGVEKLRRLFPKQRSLLSIRLLLMISVVMPILATGGLVGWLGFRHGQDSIERMTAQLNQEVSSKVTHHLKDKLMIPQQINQLNLEVIQQDLLNSKDFKQISHFFWKQSQLFEIDSIEYVDLEGKLIGIERTSDDQILLKEDLGTTDKLHIYKTNQNGERAQLLVTENYDPRQESWYQEVIKTGQPFVSVTQDLDHQSPTISVSSSYPVYNDDRKLIGVIESEFNLAQLSEFLHEINISPSSRVFILNPDGSLVTSSVTDEPSYKIVNGQIQPIKATLSQDSIIQKTAQYLTEKVDLSKIDKSQPFVFNSSGMRQFGQITPWHNSSGLDWLIVVVTSNTDFMPHIQENSQKTIGLSILAVSSAIVLALGMSRWLTLPLIQLNQVSKAIAQGKFRQIQATDTYFLGIPRIRELEGLATSFSEMARQLKDAFNQLEDNNRTLEQEIQQRSFELKESEEKFAKLFWYSPVGIAILDCVDGKLLEANDIFLRMLGRTDGEALGKIDLELDSSNPEKSLFELIQHQPNLKNFECRIRHQSGYWIDVEISVEPIKIDEQLQFLLACQDITIRKQSEAERFTLTALVENCTSLILLITTEGQLTYINSEGKKLVGLTDTMPLDALTLADFLPPEPDTSENFTQGMSNWPHLIEQLREGNSWQGEIELRHFIERDKRIPVLCNAFPIREKATHQIIGIGICMNDLQDYKETETALKLSEERHRHIVETANEGIWLLDAAGRTRYVNPRMAQMLGYNVEEILNKSLFDFLDDDESSFLEAVPFSNAHIKGKDASQTHLEQHDFKFRRKDGSQLWAIISKTSLLNPDGYYEGVLGMITDITERKQAEAALRNSVEELRLSEERLQLALEASDEGLWDLNIPTGKVYYSPRWLEMLGYQVGEISGHLSSWKQLLHPEDQKRVIEQLESYLKDNTTLYYDEYRLRTKSEEWKWVANYGKVVVRDKNGESLRMIGTHKDISLIKQRQEESEKAELQLKNSLQEKEMLLREIHHRVKNNLHVVANLLDLQTDYVDNDEILALFADSQNRIQSMALIHEQLYQSENLRQVNFGEYIHRLVSNLFSCNELNGNIESKLDVEPLLLNLETAIPCGLLINELVTNIFKHAFPESRMGKIHIQLTQDREQFLHLKVADNGIGLPKGIDWKQSSTLGLKLVRILCRQLKAEVNLETYQGTAFTFIFKELNYQPRF